MTVLAPTLRADLLTLAPADPAPPTRRNAQRQPRPWTLAFPGRVSYSALESGEAGTQTYVTAATDGPTTARGQQLTEYARWTWTSGKAGSALSGWQCRTVSARPLLDRPARFTDLIRFSAYVRYTPSAAGAVVTRLYATQYTGTAQTVPETWYGGNHAVGSGEWVQISQLLAPTEGIDALGWSLNIPSWVPNGSTLDITGIMVELHPRAGMPGPDYLDGDTPAWVDPSGWRWMPAWDDVPRHGASTITPYPPTADLAPTVHPVECSLTLDRRWTPYVQGTLTAAGDLTDLIDPRRGDRLLIEATDGAGGSPDTLADLTATGRATLADWTAAYTGETLADITLAHTTPWTPTAPTRPTLTRRFDLGIREAEWSSSTDTTTLTLASDEALALDYLHLSATPVELYGAGVSTVNSTQVIDQALSRIGAVYAGMWGSGGIPVRGSTWDVAQPYRVWEPAVPLLEYLQTIAGAYGRRIWCDEHRTWAADWTDTPNRAGTHHPDVHPTALSKRTSREVDEWADAVIVRYAWTDPGTLDRREAISIATDSPAPTKARVVDLARQPSDVWARRSLDAALNSTEWREHEADAALLLTVTPGDTTPAGRVLAVRFDLPSSTMTLKLRPEGDQ